MPELIFQNWIACGQLPDGPGGGHPVPQLSLPHQPTPPVLQCPASAAGIAPAGALLRPASRLLGEGVAGVADTPVLAVLVHRLDPSTVVQHM